MMKKGLSNLGFIFILSLLIPCTCFESIECVEKKVKLSEDEYNFLLASHDVGDISKSEPNEFIKTQKIALTIIETFIKKNGNVNITDQFGLTALHYLASRITESNILKDPHLFETIKETIEKLITARADITKQDNRGKTPFFVAVETFSKNMSPESSLDLKYYKKFEAILSSLKNKGEKSVINTKAEWGQSPLHISLFITTDEVSPNVCDFQNISEIIAILTKNKDINLSITNSRNQTPLITAIEKISDITEKGHIIKSEFTPKIIDGLAGKDGTVINAVTVENGNEYTPLHFAIKKITLDNDSNLEIMKLVIETLAKNKNIICRTCSIFGRSLSPSEYFKEKKHELLTYLKIMEDEQGELKKKKKTIDEMENIILNIEKKEINPKKIDSLAQSLSLLKAKLLQLAKSLKEKTT